MIVSAMLGLLALGDLFLAVRRTRLQVRRLLPASAPLYVWIEVRLHLSNLDRVRVSCEAFDHHPPECAIEGLPRALEIPAGGWAEFGYRLRPTREGTHPRSRSARCYSRNGEADQRIGCEQDYHVTLQLNMHLIQDLDRDSPSRQRRAGDACEFPRNVSPAASRK